MGADADTRGLRHPDGPRHHDRVGGMKSAGNVGMGDVGHAGLVIAEAIDAKRLAHVAVDRDHKPASALIHAIQYMIYLPVDGLGCQQESVPARRGRSRQALTSRPALLPKAADCQAPFPDRSVPDVCRPGPGHVLRSWPGRDGCGGGGGKEKVPDAQHGRLPDDPVAGLGAEAFGGLWVRPKTLATAPPHQVRPL